MQQLVSWKIGALYKGGKNAGACTNRMGCGWCHVNSLEHEHRHDGVLQLLYLVACTPRPSQNVDQLKKAGDQCSSIRCAGISKHLIEQLSLDFPGQIFKTAL